MQGVYIDKLTGYMVNVEKLCYDYLRDEHYVLFSDGKNDDLLLLLKKFNNQFIKLKDHKHED